MRYILAAFARNTVFANIILLLIFLAGGMASVFMVREDIPDVSLGEITVTIPYPGADPEEVEEGVSRKIEEAIDGTEGIKEYTTRSTENVSITEIIVKENYNVSDVLDRVRTKVGAISRFPPDAEKPIIAEQLHRQALMLLSLSGNISEKRLKEWAEQTKDDLQQIAQVSQIDIAGVREYEISIEVSEERLREYGLTLADVAEAVRLNNLNLAAGTIRTEGEEIRVRTVGRKYYGEDLAPIAVVTRTKGDIITLDRLARVNDGFTEDSVSVRVNGKPSALLTIFKNQDDDSLTVAGTVRSFVEKKQKQLPEGAEFRILYDTSDVLRQRINLLVKNGLMGLCLVFLLLWIFLDFRLSFWVGMGIPVSIAGALVALWAMGGTLNMLSFFGLILVLGIIVDDAIVVGEAVFVHRKNGMPPLKAAVEGAYEVGMPVFAAVITSIVAFVPLAFIRGTMGELVGIIPMVVISCLLVSLLESLILLPAHLSELPDPNSRGERTYSVLRMADKMHRRTGAWIERFAEHVYAPFMNRTAHWRYVSLCAAIALLLLTVGIIRGGILKFEALPEIDGTVINSTIEFPDGTPVEVTRKAVEQVDAALLRIAARTKTRSGEPLIADRLAIVGQTIGGEHMGQMGEKRPHVGCMQVMFLDSEKRGVHTRDLMVDWEKEVGVLPGLKSLTFEGVDTGPPGAPIEIWVQGRDMGTILAAADDLMDRLRRFEGVYQVRSDFSPGKNEIRLRLRPEARALGLTVEDLARQVYSGYYGAEALRLQRGRDDVRVKVRYCSNQRNRVADLNNVRIRTRDGHEVPLLSVASLDFSPGYAAITRTNGTRRVAVTAEVNTKWANANEIIGELSKGFFQELEANHPGSRIGLQGEQEEIRESLGSLYVGFPLAIVAIFIIMATLFRSYAQPFIILLTVPFGAIGGIYGHLLLGYHFSLMSTFGLVAVSGVVINDAIVLIERVNANLASGMSFFDSIEHAGVRRFRPILLTSITTVGGLAPLIAERSLQAQWLVPMALSLAAGVAVATIFTLFLIPSLLVILNDQRLLFHRLRHGEWPSREEVEPATHRNEDPSFDDSFPQQECITP